MKKIYFQKRLLESFQKYRERIAIEYGAREIKYSQLEKMCLSVSHWLLGHKTRKGSFIGIYIEDRVDFIAVLLGILNTGGVFIPLDTHLPIKRIEKMLQITQPGLIICDQQGQRRLLHHSQTSINPGIIICISQVFNERDDLQISLEDVVKYSSKDPIYAYFTSGTTGTPKAILGKNISLLHFINWEIQTFAINETFRVSQLTRLGFDAFLRDLFVPLVVGGTLCIPGNPEILMDSESLIYWLETNRIGLVHCVPSIFRIFNTNALKKENFQHLKYVLLSGENVIPQELKNWFDIMGNRIQLVNLYGPTETTMIKTCYYIKKEDVNRGRIPIGKPMKGARLILFDKNMKICKPGFIGDIYIRTPYRTFGYLNDPQLNLEKFIPNPLGRKQTDLLFKTGDQGLELPEGNFEFLGRTDRQVKIRGIRVELEEVERVMIQHPAIDNAAVTARESKNGDNYLCAFFISPKRVEISKLKEYLSEELPDYMIPSYFLQLEAFPLSSNGKLDRNALPAPGLRPVENDEAPVGRIQETLANLWSEVLNVDRKQIGIHSDFFELGGHSLKAINLVADIQREFNIELSIRDIFRFPTIEKLAGIIQRGDFLPLSGIPGQPEREYYDLSYSQQRLWYLYLQDPDGTAFNMPGRVTLYDAVDETIIRRVMQRLIRHHESLRTYFKEIDKRVRQVIEPDIPLSLESVDLSGLDKVELEQQRNLLYLEILSQPFDLTRVPLFRTQLLKCNDKEFDFIFCLHHIISDGWSMEILQHQFTRLFEAAKRGIEYQLESLQIQYKDYCHWQNQVLSDEERVGKAIESWKERLSGYLPIMNLPYDNPSASLKNKKTAAYRVVIPAVSTSKLRDLARENNTSLFMVLLAAFNLLLFHITGQEDIVIAIPAAARQHGTLKNIIGMFVNTLILRNKVSPGVTFRQFLEHVQEDTFKALEYQSFPLELICSQLKIKYPEISVFFNMINTGDNHLQDLKDLESYHIDQVRPSKFNMHCYLKEYRNGINIQCHYFSSLFKPTSIQKITRIYMESLEKISNSPDGKVTQYHQAVKKPRLIRG